MARIVLEDPPPLTPANQQNFPYVARPFPTRWLLENSGLKSHPAPATPKAAEDDEPNRVE